MAFPRGRRDSRAQDEGQLVFRIQDAHRHKPGGNRDGGCRDIRRGGGRRPDAGPD